MMKKLIMTLVVLGIIACASIGFASNAAVNAAKAEIPATCEMFSYEEDDGKTEMYFRDSASGMLYKVEAISATGRILEIEIKNRNIIHSNNVVKSYEDIKNIVKAAYPDARNIIVNLKRSFTKAEYEVDFITDKYKGEAELNAETGEFEEIELEYFW